MKITLLFLSLLLLNNNVISQKVGINTTNPQETLDINGDLLIRDKLYIKNGLNSSIGEAMLVSGLAKVFTKKITKKSVVFFSYKKPNFGTLEPFVLIVREEDIVDGVSFIIRSELAYPEPFNLVNENDNSILKWWIVEPEN